MNRERVATGTAPTGAIRPEAAVRHSFPISPKGRCCTLKQGPFASNRSMPGMNLTVEIKRDSANHRLCARPIQGTTSESLRGALNEIHINCCDSDFDVPQGVSASPTTKVPPSGYAFGRAVAKSLGHVIGIPPALYTESIDGPGREKRYQGIDIDGDGISDIVNTDCGSSSYGECELSVKLSSMPKYGFAHEYPFYLIRYQSKQYAVVNDDFEEKNAQRRSAQRSLIGLTPRGARTVCKSL